MGLSGASAYTKVNATSGVENADPHLLIQMLIDGAIEKMNRAKYFLQAKDIAKKGEHISWAISIIGGLKASLNLEKGGEVATTLDALYEYCTLTLAQANIENDISQIDAALKVMNEVKEGWDGIREQALQTAE